MGNTAPTNHTDKKATAQKFENAKKLGILSLREHGLQEIPTQMMDSTFVSKLRTLDLSKNNLMNIDSLCIYVELKNLNLDDNQLYAGSVNCLTKLMKLQNLSLANNKLGRLPSESSLNNNNHNIHKRKPIPIIVMGKKSPIPKSTTSTSSSTSQSLPIQALPEPLPPSLKQLNLSSNLLSCIPTSVLSITLIQLEKLDLSNNQLIIIPIEIQYIQNIQELNFDQNQIRSIPEEIGNLSKLKILSLRNNQIQMKVNTDGGSAITPSQPPFPKSLFSNTVLIDLNLHGNPLTNTEMNTIDGYSDYLNRRQKVKSKNMSNTLETACGLE